MSEKAWVRLASTGVAACVSWASVAPAAMAAETPDDAAARLEILKRQIAEQTRRLDELRRALSAQEGSLQELRRAVAGETLATQRGAGAPGVGAQAAQGQTAQAQAPQPVGVAPERDSRPPQVATIFEQPGVLTPRGKFVLEPSLQYSYSSSNRLALVGYTIIPAVLIGVIDVREVKRNTFTAALTGRYGLTNRFEIEGRVPYVYRSDSTIGREILQGAATVTPFEASGSDIGDVELSARYQFNDGGTDSPFYIGSLRVKSRTGTDPFDVNTTNQLIGLRDGGVQTELPTGSGFYGLQPAITMLYPSDPVVFFGSLSYLYNFKRSDASLLIDGVRTPLGEVKTGDVIGFNFGMGLALNERASFSIGYDHSSVGKTKVNGVRSPDSVRVQLGTLLLGYSFRIKPQQTLNLSLGVGVTRDTPDMTLTLRVPVTF